MVIKLFFIHLNQLINTRNMHLSIRNLLIALLILSTQSFFSQSEGSEFDISTLIVMPGNWAKRPYKKTMLEGFDYHLIKLMKNNGVENYNSLEVKRKWLRDNYTRIYEKDYYEDSFTFHWVTALLSQFSYRLKDIILHYNLEPNLLNRKIPLLISKEANNNNNDDLFMTQCCTALIYSEWIDKEYNLLDLVDFARSSHILYAGIGIAIGINRGAPLNSKIEFDAFYHWLVASGYSHSSDYKRDQLSISRHLFSSKAKDERKTIEGMGVKAEVNNKYNSDGYLTFRKIQSTEWEYSYNQDNELNRFIKKREIDTNEDYLIDTDFRFSNNLLDGKVTFNHQDPEFNSSDFTLSTLLLNKMTLNYKDGELDGWASFEYFDEAIRKRKIYFKDGNPVLDSIQNNGGDNNYQLERNLKMLHNGLVGLVRKFPKEGSIGTLYHKDACRKIKLMRDVYNKMDTESQAKLKEHENPDLLFDEFNCK